MIEWDYKKLPIHYFFSKGVEFIDNAIKTTYDSGRVTVHKKNAVNKKKISTTYLADKAKRDSFMKWYNELGGNGVEFLLEGLEGEGKKKYIFSDTPKISGFVTFEITINLEEVG